MNTLYITIENQYLKTKINTATNKLSKFSTCSHHQNPPKFSSIALLNFTHD
jgi:hypothetical protein